MHYLNGRAVKAGDWIIGPTHSSDNELRCGIVQEVYGKERGDCNIRIHIWTDEHFTEEGAPRVIKAEQSRGREEYADCKRCIKASDGWRMVDAVTGHGLWNGPYGNYAR